MNIGLSFNAGAKRLVSGDENAADVVDDVAGSSIGGSWVKAGTFLARVRAGLVVSGRDPTQRDAPSSGIQLTGSRGRLDAVQLRDQAGAKETQYCACWW